MKGMRLTLRGKIVFSILAITFSLFLAIAALKFLDSAYPYTDDRSVSEAPACLPGTRALPDGSCISKE